MGRGKKTFTIQNAAKRVHGKVKRLEKEQEFEGLRQNSDSRWRNRN